MQTFSGHRGHTLASPITFEANRVYWAGWHGPRAPLQGLQPTALTCWAFPQATSLFRPTVILRCVDVANSGVSRVKTSKENEYELRGIL